MLKLNKCEIDFERLFKRAPIVLAKRTPQILDTSVDMEVRQQATFVVANKYFELAYAHYALENFSEVKPNFQKAAPFAFLRGFDPELKTHNTDLSIQEELNVCLLFGEPDLLQQLKDFNWSLPEDDMMHPVIYQFDLLLIQIGTGNMPTKTAVNIAADSAKNAKNKDVLQFFLPLIEAISALINGDQTLWQTSIDKAITWHTDECKFGYLKDMEEGFICLNALTMAKLGKQMHGWQCATHSLYLPLFLID